MNEQPMPEPTAPQPGQPEQAPPPEKFPVGLIFIIILTGMGMLGSLMQVVNPMVIIGTAAITGFPALLYGLIQLGVYIALFVWLIQRKEKGRILGIAVSVYIMLLAGLQFLVFFFRSDEMLALYDEMMPGYTDMVPSSFHMVIWGVSAMLSWVIGTAVISYLYIKRQHFRP